MSIQSFHMIINVRVIPL